MVLFFERGGQAEDAVILGQLAERRGERLGEALGAGGGVQGGQIVGDPTAGPCSCRTTSPSPTSRDAR